MDFPSPARLAGGAAGKIQDSGYWIGGRLRLGLPLFFRFPPRLEAGDSAQSDCREGEVVRIGEAQRVKAESQLRTTLKDCQEMIAQVRPIDGETASALEEKAEDIARRIDRLNLLAGDEEWERLRFETEDLVGDLENRCRWAKG